eukprot:CAMPEP_0172479590 /NCGR_PEP_ID=MMETSP1066-20121228/4302_1 /TAXON_ID=671091 /ORGANISM="Coscinodiscus wailesii, Strain CCMP2513" /LENGTH=49 /DNA_ID= /DNA_START= /DNA_END= /DNA_ORIENTATION=
MILAPYWRCIEEDKITIRIVVIVFDRSKKRAFDNPDSAVQAVARDLNLP